MALLCPTTPVNCPQELQAAVGFPEYYAEEARYAVVLPTSGNGGGSSANSSASDGGGGAAAAAAAAQGVEPDVVLEPGSRPAASDSASMGTVDLVPSKAGTDGEQRQSYGARDQADKKPTWLRVRVMDTRSKTTTLDTRFPAGGWLGCWGAVGLWRPAGVWADAGRLAAWGRVHAVGHNPTHALDHPQQLQAS